jgi:hypothetical protein
MLNAIHRECSLHQPIDTLGDRIQKMIEQPKEGS